MRPKWNTPFAGVFSLALVSVSLAVVTVSGASAATICFGGDLGPGVCSPGAEQKVFLDSGTGTTGSGNVGSQVGLPEVAFASGSSLDYANGFANIKPDTGDYFGDLSFTIPGYTFKDLLFDAQMFNNRAVDLNFTVSAYNGATLLGSYTYTSLDGLSHDANKSFIVLSLDDPMTRIAWSSTSGFKELKHFEVSDIAAAVPEPSTWAMMLIGFAGLGLVASRRRRIAVAA